MIEEITAWLRRVSDRASGTAKDLRATGHADLAAAIERVAEEAHTAERKARETKEKL